MKKFTSITTAILIALTVLAASMSLLPQAMATEAQAAPQAAVTPVTFLARNTVITEDFTTDPVEVADHTTLFIQHAIDQGASTHAISITMQRSVNGWEWISNTELVTTTTTDGDSAILTHTVGERYIRFLLDVADANTNPVTPSISAVGK